MTAEGYVYDWYQVLKSSVPNTTFSIFVIGILELDVLDLETWVLRLEGVVVEEKEDEDDLAGCAPGVLNFDAFFETPLVLGIVGDDYQYFDATVSFVVNDASNDCRRC